MTGGPGGDRPVLVVLAAGMAKRYGGTKPLAPVGLHGEAVIDLTAADGVSSGFSDIVLVLGPQTGPAIIYHVRRCFPDRVRVAFAEQRVALGTAHAVLCARKHVGDGPFAVVNSDDIYGVPALSLLAAHLRDSDEHAIGTYRLRDTIVASDPVTRGVCHLRPDGHLASLEERRTVSPLPDGSFRADDGLEPTLLGGDTPVSMNLWGFQPAIWQVLEAAVVAEYPEVSSDGTAREHEGFEVTTEVLLPEVVGAMAASGASHGREGAVRVLRVPGRCIGVTHADDLLAVRHELAGMVGRGERPEHPWEAMG
jgi:hypothetical protein